MFTLDELMEAYSQIDEFNADHKGHYRMSCHSDSKGLHITVVDLELKQMFSWQPVKDNDELHEFIMMTCW